MKPIRIHLSCTGLVLGMLTASLSAQTDGTAALNAVIHDYPGNGDNHYTVVWVTNSSNQFIRTLWKQGPGFSSGRWDEHFRTWNDARGSDTTVDGYSSATARDYTSSSNNPIDPVWNCRDKNGTLVPDGNYKFWVQYVEEDDGQGPLTTLLWTKGSAAFSKDDYPDHYEGGELHHSNLSVTWTPAAEPPTITSAAPPSTATLGVPYSHTCTADGTAPITFTAPGLPSGLEISAAGMITGIPSAPGVFNGTITASNAAPSSANQAFSITVIEIPAMISTVDLAGYYFLMEGSGPPGGFFTIMGTSDPSQPINNWTPLKSGGFDALGRFSNFVPITPNESKFFYRLRVP